MKSILVIGMGRFGRHLAKTFLALKNNVMIIDRNPEIISDLMSSFDDAQIGDCTKESVLHAIGVNNFDVCFVCIGSNFQSSLEITSMLKELGAQWVVSQAGRDIHAKFLRQNGADEVIYPERDMAEKVAMRHNGKNIFDFIEITDEYSIFEIPILDYWAGKTIATVDVRRKYRINIIAIKKGTKIIPVPGSDYVFDVSDHLFVMGKSADVFKLSART